MKFSPSTMRGILLVTVLFISCTQGVPVPEENPGWVRAFLRSNEYQICVNNVFMPGAITSVNSSRSDSEGENPSSSSETGFPGASNFQECLQQAITSFSEHTPRNKRSASEDKEGGDPGSDNESVTPVGSSGSGCGQQGVSPDQINHCMQQAMNFNSFTSGLPGGGKFPGSEYFSGFGGGRRRRSESRERSESGQNGGQAINQNAFQTCINSFQPGINGVPSIPGMSSGKKRRESSEDKEDGKGDGDNSAVGESNSGCGQQGVSPDQINHCMQQAMNFNSFTSGLPGGGKFPGSEYLSGFGGGRRKRDRSSYSARGETNKESGDQTINQNAFQACINSFQPGIPGAPSIPGMSSGKAKREASEDKEDVKGDGENNTSGGSSFGSSSGSGCEQQGVSPDQINHCMQQAMNFNSFTSGLPGGGKFPGSEYFSGFGGGRKRRSESRENSESGQNGGQAINQNAFQTCINSFQPGIPGAPSIPGMSSGKKRREASEDKEDGKGDGENITDGGSSSGSSSSSGCGQQGVSPDQINHCMQQAMNFNSFTSGLPGGGKFPGSEYLSGFGGGRRKRDKTSNSARGENNEGSGDQTINQNAFQTCINSFQTSVPGAPGIPGMSSG